MVCGIIKLRLDFCHAYRKQFWSGGLMVKEFDFQTICSGFELCSILPQFKQPASVLSALVLRVWLVIQVSEEWVNLHKNVLI